MPNTELIEIYAIRGLVPTVYFNNENRRLSPKVRSQYMEKSVPVGWLTSSSIREFISDAYLQYGHFISDKYAPVLKHISEYTDALVSVNAPYKVEHYSAYCYLYLLSNKYSRSLFRTIVNAYSEGLV